MRKVWCTGVIYLLLSLSGIHAQDDEYDVDPDDGKIKGACGYTDWEFEEPQCPTNRSEIYKECQSGQCYKLCCTTDSKAEESTKSQGTACRTTQCLSATSRNLCSTLRQRWVMDTKLNYEETLRDTCTKGTEADTTQGIVALCCPLNSTDGLLVSTYGAEKHEFPHMAHLSMGCGGTIYNKNHILTAAHCVVNDHVANAPESITVTLGTNIGDLNSKDHKYNVSAVMVHEKYSDLKGHPELKKPKNQRRTYNDVAILKLSNNIKFSSYIKSLKMAPTGFVAKEFADNAVIVGWGTADNLQLTKHLQKANFIIRDDKKCFHNGVWGTMKQFDDQYLCVGGTMEGEFSPVAGGGDSGGPAICRDQTGHAILCGVTSFGGSDEKCAANRTESNCPPSVYAEVQHFREWITDKAGDQDEATFYKPYLYGEDLERRMDHQVHITSGGGKPCGGTLIRSDIVVTAAQCVSDGSGKTYKNIKVVSGLKDLNTKEGTVHTVKKVAVLQGFQRVGNKVDPAKQGDRIRITDNYHKNDLAVIKLNEKAKMRTRNLPVMPSMDDLTPDTGMEISFPRNTKYSGKMMQRQFTLLDRGDCQTRMNRLERAGINVKIDDNIICGVEKYSGGSQCNRELGGGLICQGEDGRDVLCGIQVFRLCEWSIPNGFINMGLYKNWVEKAIKAL